MFMCKWETEKKIKRREKRKKAGQQANKTEEQLKNREQVDNKR